MRTVNLHGGCLRSADCGAFATRTFEQLNRAQYLCGVSVMETPADPAEYLGRVRTARKRASRASRLGYTFARVDRHAHEAAVDEINASAPMRQGRPMSDGYRRPHRFSDPEWGCPLHAVHPYGVLDMTGRLRAYLWLYRVGELALVSQILGHADHLTNDVMYLLFTGMVADQARISPGIVFYNRHDSGTDGLRFFKERVGLDAGDVEWRLV